MVTRAHPQKYAKTMRYYKQLLNKPLSKLKKSLTLRTPREWIKDESALVICFCFVPCRALHIHIYIRSMPKGMYAPKGGGTIYKFTMRYSLFATLHISLFLSHCIHKNIKPHLKQNFFKKISHPKMTKILSKLNKTFIYTRNFQIMAKIWQSRRMHKKYFFFKNAITPCFLFKEKLIQVS